jgi:hypothetical protein
MRTSHGDGSHFVETAIAAAVNFAHAVMKNTHAPGRGARREPQHFINA